MSGTLCILDGISFFIKLGKHGKSHLLGHQLLTKSFVNYKSFNLMGKIEMYLPSNYYKLL